ncbi:hypothetical protein RJ639_002270 [Escallonia herrerae]|uniref:Rapid alkalinization factor n=1 Tax=Escallonia herrerae TaxID=1293975 RepID=A0AA88X8I6_9ASTE|nr:hypothetical protein RJ639_002270 [Escallonia herrerae]
MAATSCPSMILTLCFITTLLLPPAAASGDHPSRLGWIPTARSGCRGTVAECLEVADEFQLDSESSRRVLASSNHISYEALGRDNIPCSQRGASYYNCKPGAQANPYTRGCSAITRCRS